MKQEYRYRQEAISSSAFFFFFFLLPHNGSWDWQVEFTKDVFTASTASRQSVGDGSKVFELIQNGPRGTLT